MLENLALYEPERLEPPADSILTAQMLKTADNLRATIRNLENEREAIIGLHLRLLPNNLKAQVFENYDNEIRNRRQELADVRQNLAGMGYIV